MQKNILYNRKKKDPMEFSTPKNVLYQEPFKIKESLGLTEEAVPTATSDQAVNIPETPPSNLLSLPKDSFSQYWKQPVGKTQIPLDQFVRLAGMAAHALDPTGFGGRLGKDLSTMGAEAYGERARRTYETQKEESKREYESPNKLLRRQLLTAQIRKINQEQPGKWEAYTTWATKQGIPMNKQLEDFTKRTTSTAKPTYKYIEDSKGAVSVFANGALVSGSGKGKDITQAVGSHITDDKGIVTFYDKQGNVLSKKPGGKTKRGTEPTPKQLADVEEKILLNSDLPELAAQVDLFNKYGGKDYTYKLETTDAIEKFKLLGVGIPFTGTEGTQQWVKVPREEKAGVKPDVVEPPKYTEAQLRTMLTDKQVADPSIDIEKAMKFYKSKGMY